MEYYIMFLREAGALFKAFAPFAGYVGIGSFIAMTLLVLKAG